MLTLVRFFSLRLNKTSPHLPASKIFGGLLRPQKGSAIGLYSSCLDEVAIMTAQNKDEYCLECHWEAFNLDGSEENSSGEKQQPELVCPGEEHHNLSKCDENEEDEACCDVDDCSITCPSVCDGFVECDEGTACSVSHCDDNNCDENHCDENNCDEDHCDNNDPVCFQDHCFTQDQDSADHGLESFLGLAAPPLNLETNDLLSSTTLGNNQLEQSLKNSENAMISSHHSTDPSSFFPPYTSIPPTHCHSHVPDHFNCHNYGHLMHPTYPVQNNVNPADVFHMLGMCTDFSTCPIPEEQHCQHNHQLNGDTSSTQFPLTCFHTDHHHFHTDHHPHLTNHNQNNNNNHSPAPSTINHHHHHHQIKSPAIGTRLPAKGPCRTHHRCRVHGHHHTHPFSPYSRQSRSSISSHLISSPGETPPPLDGGASSVITSPEFSPVDQDLHVCKWATTHHGIKNSCGATFADAGALQKHLISSHMSTVDGAKGNGYYCCWEGCHRPHEPFSQKSKLQGHFLTHSNCMPPSPLPFGSGSSCYLMLIEQQIKTLNAPSAARYSPVKPPWTAMNAATGVRNHTSAPIVVKCLPTVVN